MVREIVCIIVTAFVEPMVWVTNVFLDSGKVFELKQVILRTKLVKNQKILSRKCFSDDVLPRNCEQPARM